MEAESFDLADPPPGFTDDPFPWYALLQARSPIHPLSDGSWLLTRYADCAAVCRDVRFSRQRDYAKCRRGLAKRFSPP